jgi:hypothetical protein
VPLGQDGQAGVGAAEVHDRRDLLVLELGEHLAFQQHRAGGSFAARRLQGDHAGGIDLVGLVDVLLAAGADEAEDAVAVLEAKRRVLRQRLPGCRQKPR